MFYWQGVSPPTMWFSGVSRVISGSLLYAAAVAAAAAAAQLRAASAPPAARDEFLTLAEALALWGSFWRPREFGHAKI
jgi:hypothetical protein